MFGRNNKVDTTWLADVAFFQGFTDEQLAEVAELGDRVEAEAGVEITDQGRMGNACFVIVEGTANVSMNGEYVASVNAGSMVGEMALLEHRPRSASVIAETDMVLVSFGVEQFRALLDRNPSANERVLSLLQARATQNQARKEQS